MNCNKCTTLIKDAKIVEARWGHKDIYGNSLYLTDPLFYKLKIVPNNKAYSFKLLFRIKN